MTKPQQPELHRSGLGDSDPGSIKVQLQGTKQPKSEGNISPVPEDNQPGHHPAKEQDKPDLG